MTGSATRWMKIFATGKSCRKILLFFRQKRFLFLTAFWLRAYKTLSFLGAHSKFSLSNWKRTILNCIGNTSPAFSRKSKVSYFVIFFILCMIRSMLCDDFIKIYIKCFSAIPVACSNSVWICIFKFYITLSSLRFLLFFFCLLLRLHKADFQGHIAYLYAAAWSLFSRIRKYKFPCHSDSGKCLYQSPHLQEGGSLQLFCTQSWSFCIEWIKDVFKRFRFKFITLSYESSYWSYHGKLMIFQKLFFNWFVF